MLKFVKCIIVTLLALSVFTFDCNAAAVARCWYTKRNGHLPPMPPEDYEVLKRYGAYYINDSLGDNEKKLYLTFDAGYENGNVEKILDILDAEGIKGAFFILDNLIVTNTALVKRMASEGHLVCNHTKRHKDLSLAEKNEIVSDLQALENLYREYTGNEMAKYFRFPEGKYSENALKTVYEMGYKTVFWSFAYEDWDNSKQPSKEYATKKILDNTHNGAIILLHPTSDTNAQILPTLISKWKSMGYSFGTLDELS